jgi:IS1 family transposase
LKQPLATVVAPSDDVIEMDEICLRQSSSLWLWIAISRKVRQVLGFVLGNRSDAMLPCLWSDVPIDYRDKPVATDGWSAYSRFFPASQHQVVGKGSGLTSQVEGHHTKWRQRQSGLVRRSCGVYPGITEDIEERFLILLEQHNNDKARRFRRAHYRTTQLNP